VCSHVCMCEIFYQKAKTMREKKKRHNRTKLKIKVQIKWLPNKIIFSVFLIAHIYFSVVTYLPTLSHKQHNLILLCILYFFAFAFALYVSVCVCVCVCLIYDKMPFTFFKRRIFFCTHIRFASVCVLYACVWRVCVCERVCV